MAKQQELVSLEVVNFRQEMERIEQEVLALSNKEIEIKIDYATEQLRRVTPVDTGEARSGWSNQKSKELDGSSSGVIKNPVEHIVYLNNGHSQQAPQYFIEQVLLTVGLITS